MAVTKIINKVKKAFNKARVEPNRVKLQIYQNLPTAVTLYLCFAFTICFLSYISYNNMNTIAKLITYSPSEAKKFVTNANYIIEKNLSIPTILINSIIYFLFMVIFPSFVIKEQKIYNGYVLITRWIMLMLSFLYLINGVKTFSDMSAMSVSEAINLQIKNKCLEDVKCNSEYVNINSKNISNAEKTKLQAYLIKSFAMTFESK